MVYNYNLILSKIQQKHVNPKNMKINTTLFHKKLKNTQLNNFFKKTFKTFLHLTLPTNNFPFKIHQSFNNLYVVNTSKGSPKLFSIAKFIKNYNSM